MLVLAPVPESLNASGRQANHRLDDRLAAVEMPRLGVLFTHDVLANVLVTAVAQHAVGRMISSRPPGFSNCRQRSRNNTDGSMLVGFTEFHTPLLFGLAPIASPETVGSYV